MATTALVRIHPARSLGPSFFDKRTLATLVRLVATVLAFAPGLALAQAGTTTHIQTDGSLGAAVLLDSQSTDSSLYVIGEDLGSVIEQNLYHSFEQFDLATGDTGRFTGSSAISNVVSRITGANPSHLEGKLESKIPGANFYFLNPNGVLFGQNAQVSVPAAFHVSSAENGSFANGMRLVLDSDTGLPSNLEMAPIEKFGFIGGEIKLSGTTLLFGDFGSFDPGSSDTIGGDLSFRGGDIELSQGAKLLGLNKTVTVQASGDLSLNGVSIIDGFGSGIDVANFGDQGPNQQPESIQLSGRNVELGESSYLIAETIGAGCDSSSGASCTGQIVIEATSRITLNPGTQDPEPSEFSSRRFPGLNIDSAPGSSPATILTYRNASSGDDGSVRLKASEIFLVDESRVQALERDPDNISTPRSTGNVEKIGTILPLPPATPPSIEDPVELLPIPEKDPFPPENGTEPGFDADPGPILVEETPPGPPPVGLGPPGVDESAAGPGPGTTAETNTESEGSNFLAPYMNMSSRFKFALEECKAQSADPNSDSFRTNRWPGLPLSPEGPLLAFSPLGMDSTTPGATRGNSTQEAYLKDLSKGAEALRGGRTNQSFKAFENAERVAKAAGDAAAQSDALRGIAEAKQAEGAYVQSVYPLEQAIDLARSSNDPVREAAALGALGNAYVALGEHESAESLLEQAVSVSRGIQISTSSSASPQKLAKKAKRPPADVSLPTGLTSALLNNLGNQRAISGNSEGALAAYEESALLARKSEKWLQAAQAGANAAHTALILEKEETAIRVLAFAHQALALAKTTPAQETTLRIHLAQSEALLAQRNPAGRRLALLTAHEDLLAAIENAEERGDLRAASHGLGSLGALYAEDQGREREAFHLTRRALRSAEEAQATDLLARWYAQLGGFNLEIGQTNAALENYRKAVVLLEETRPEASVVYGSADVAFKRAVEPIYIALVDLLLKSSTSAPKPETTQEILTEARNVIEQWKTAELRSYFQDGCIADVKNVSLDSLDPGAAVVYPIPLPDRLEILVSGASGISRFTVPVGKTQLESEAERFRVLLTNRTSNRYKQPARQLYDWLVAPYRSLLWKSGIDTLVFVPTGALRTIPMSALHDGENFLIKSYAIAVTPSMKLLTPKPLVASDTNILLAGLSEAVQGFPSLPSVPEELSAVEKIYGGQVLLNESFEFENLSRALTDKATGVVHIASHAEFASNTEDSFVLTYNDRLSMDELASLIRGANLSGEPIELLILSACQTALGDDRAALGLAGVAIRAGARSAMGSLWSVSDAATSELVVGFYEALQVPNSNKAQALRAAQSSLIADQRFKHPFYWAPFMIINNWL